MAREFGEGAEAESDHGAAPLRMVDDADLLDELLGHDRRRYVCYALVLDPEWSIDDLATSVAGWEHGIPEGEVPEAEREQVYVSLFHAHLPKLAEQGMVSFDPVSETVSAAESGERILRRLFPRGSNSRRE